MNLSSLALSLRIAQLPELPMENLWAVWDQLFRHRPGHHHRTYLESRIAYQWQVQAHSPITKSLQRRLQRIGQTGVIPNLQRRNEFQIAAGTELSREFNGEQHRITALESGQFAYRGQRYSSLSAAARAICGTSVSGPVFFGLKLASRPLPRGGQ